jgi:PAS domain S-box-containing protein
LTGQRDYRGREVVAAYGVLAPWRIGMVHKIDAEEFYAPLRRQLWFALLGLAGLIGAGAWLLYSRTKPLARRLRDTSARLAAALDNIPAGVLTYHYSGRIVTANSGAERMLGYPPGALCGRLLADCLGEEMAAAACRIDGPRVHQGHADRRDGNRFYLRAQAGQFHVDGVAKGILVLQDVSEQVAFEAGLRRSEGSLAHAQKMARLGSWERDFDSGTDYWSPTTFALFGLPPGPVPDPEVLNAMVDARDRDAVIAAERACLERGLPYDLSFRIYLPDGALRVLHARAEIEYGPDGEPARQRGTVQDISDRWLGERRLRASEEEFRALAANSPDVIVRFDRGARCVYVSPAVEHAQGLKWLVQAGQVPQSPSTQPDLGPQWRAAIDDVFAHGANVTFESVFHAQTGPTYYQVRMVPESDAAGHTAAVLAVARDITAIRTGQTELEASQQRLQSIAANTPGIVFQFEIDAAAALRYTYVSDGALDLLGVAPEDALADSAALLGRLHPDDRVRFRAELERAGAALEGIDCEGRASGADGGQVWINCRATPRRLPGGTVVWAGVMLNITARKHNEQELAESRRLLRELATHREAVREQERRKLAREVHDELGQSLTALRMDVALLRLQFGAAQPGMLGRLDDMTACVDRTIGLVRDITSSLRPAALDLGLVPALEWLLADLRRRAPFELHMHAPAADLLLDDGSATALFRIAQESLTNVLKHAAAHHVTLDLSVQQGMVVMEISDDGAGFDSAVARRRGAFGLLGMRERVLALAGTMTVDSAPGHGTRLRVSLPILQQEHH